MTISASIFSGLQRLQRAGRPLDLLNLHQGAPIVYAATVQALDEEVATLRVPGFEIVCLTLEPTTILLSQMLEEAVSARVLAVDLRAGTAALGQFRYASSRVGDRMTVRVAPQPAAAVSLEYGDHVFAGQLADVSISGVGLHLPSVQAALLRPRGVVRLRLELPGVGTEPLSLSGTIRFVRSDGAQSRVGVVFAQDVQTLTILHYVRDRQEAILAELRTLHQARLAAG